MQMSQAASVINQSNTCKEELILKIFLSESSIKLFFTESMY